MLGGEVPSCLRCWVLIEGASLTKFCWSGFGLLYRASVCSYYTFSAQHWRGFLLLSHLNPPPGASLVEVGLNHALVCAGEGVKLRREQVRKVLGAEEARRALATLVDDVAEALLRELPLKDLLLQRP